MGSHDYFRRRLLAAVYDSLSPGELLARVRADDPEAFVALVRDRYPLVAAAVRRRLRPTEPVEDVVLDVFAELWRRRTAIADPAAVDGWLGRTAERMAGRWAADAVRDRTWRPDPTSPPGPFDAAAAAELGERVRQAVAELSAADRAVIAAAGAFESDAEAAGVLGVSVPTYRVRLHRARERLRPILQRFGLGPPLGLLGWAGGLFARGWRTKLGNAAAGGLAVVLLGSGSRPAAVPPPPVMTVPDDQRAFREHVIPAVERHLQALALGNAGTVRTTHARLTADRLDLRVRVTGRHLAADGRELFVLRHAFEFRLHRPTGALRVLFAEGDRTPRVMDLTQPLIVAPLGLFGSLAGEQKLDLPPLREAVRAVRTLGPAGDAECRRQADRMYRVVLERGPTADELEFVVRHTWHAGHDLAGIAACRLVGGPEYLDRFVRPHPPAEAARLFLDRLYAPAAVTAADREHVTRIFTDHPAAPIRPALEYGWSRGLRSRWQAESLE